MDNYDKMHRLEAEMHRLEAEVARLRHTLIEQEREMDAIRKQVTDMEAERFADKCEIEMDLERWDGIYAAQVGRDLEDVADRLIEALEAERKGEDVRGILWGVHGDVCSIMADISTDAADELDQHEATMPR